MTQNFMISTLPKGPIPPEVLEETRRWHAEALRQAYEAMDIEEIERLKQNSLENFARQGMIDDAR